MASEESKNLGDWGRMTPAGDHTHITQTNEKSHDGRGAHITTQIEGVSIRTRFGDNGESGGTDID